MFQYESILLGYLLKADWLPTIHTYLHKCTLWLMYMHTDTEYTHCSHEWLYDYSLSYTERIPIIRNWLGREGFAILTEAE